LCLIAFTLSIIKKNSKKIIICTKIFLLRVRSAKFSRPGADPDLSNSDPDPDPNPSGSGSGPTRRALVAAGVALGSLVTYEYFEIEQQNEFFHN